MRRETFFQALKEPLEIRISSFHDPVVGQRGDGVNSVTLLEPFPLHGLWLSDMHGDIFGIDQHGFLVVKAVLFTVVFLAAIFIVSSLVKVFQSRI